MNNKKTIYAVCLLLLVTVISVGYALIEGKLNINGSAKITAATWEIYFKNVEIEDGSVLATQEPTITDKTSLSYNINLNTPGDYYEFNVDVVNNGDLDAMIDKITITPDISDKPYLEYTVKYLDNSDVEEKDILHSKKARTIKVRVEYKKDIENNELNSSEQNLNMSFKMKYVQADATGKVPTAADKPAFKAVVVTGDGTHVGDEITLGDEHFYVISNNGTNIKMLAKYNLNAADPYNSSLIYKQNINSTLSPVSFSRYWGRDVSDGTYVYDNRANISNYVNSYKNYLESFGTTVIEARLISKYELEGLGCKGSNGNYGPNSCLSAPSWVYTTDYYTGSVKNEYGIWGILSNYKGIFHNYNSNYFNYNVGVRPVIVIPVEAI